MARLARVVIPNIPHHIIQRGNRRQRVFFKPEDKEAYLSLLKEHLLPSGNKILSYCLMDNHVHLIVVPETTDSLRAGLSRVHRHYTRMINFREGWRGYLWQGRFLSYPMDSRHLYNGIRYVERNPVDAKIVQNAEDYKWSSARFRVNQVGCHLLEKLDDYFKIENYRDYLSEWDVKEVARIDYHIRTGRPMGDEKFIEQLEVLLGRSLKKRQVGRKKAKEENT